MVSVGDMVSFPMQTDDRTIPIYDIGVVVGLAGADAKLVYTDSAGKLSFVRRRLDRLRIESKHE